MPGNTTIALPPTAPSPGPNFGDVFKNITAPLDPVLKSDLRKEIIVEELIVFSLVLLTVFLTLAAKRSGFAKYFGETSISVSIGVVVGLIIMSTSQTGLQDAIAMDSNIFYTLVLPPIIFEAGYGMSRSLFFKNFSPIMLLSFVGAAFSASVTGGVVYWLMHFTSYPLSFFQSATFGVIMSATDPISVLTIFNEIPINPNLHMIVFGESAINDSVAIIFFRLVTAFAGPGVVFGLDSFFITCAAVFGIFLASVLIGVVLALLAALILKHINVGQHGLAMEMTCVLIFAYSSYLLADLIRCSGIVSILFCGATMAKYVHPNLTPESQSNTKNMLRVLSFIAETALFIYLGLGLPAFRSDQRSFDASFICIGLFALLIGRLHVFIILPITNIWKGESRLTWRHMLYIFYAGLRGAIPFVLSLDLSENLNYDSKFRGMVLGATMIIVLVSVVLGGTMAYPMVKLLQLDQEPEGQFLHDEEGASGSDDRKNRKTKLQIRRKDLFEWDQKYLRPFFTKESPADLESKGKNGEEIELRSKTGQIGLDEHQRGPSKRKELFNAPDDM